MECGGQFLGHAEGETQGWVEQAEGYFWKVDTSRHIYIQRAELEENGEIWKYLVGNGRKN